MRIFVSCYDIESQPAQQFICALNDCGFEISHSPPVPDGRDELPEWENYYDGRLPKLMDDCDAFVIVLNRVWDSSTWMAIESEEALKRHRGDKKFAMFVFNPQELVIKSAGMIHYLHEELPKDALNAATLMKKRLANVV